MGERAIIAETLSDGRIKYEYDHHGAVSASSEENPFRGPFTSSESPEKISEKYPSNEEFQIADSLETFIENNICSGQSMIKALWIDGRCYNFVREKLVLVECRTKEEFNDFSEEFKTEWGNIDDDALQNTDRNFIDLR